jgi:hypothetical protein
MAGTDVPFLLEIEGGLPINRPWISVLSTR